MAVLSGGKKLEAALNDIAKKINKRGELQVGYMEGARYPDGTQVAAVAAFQNFGAPRAGIPPRPFFTFMVENGQKHWGSDLGNWLQSTDYDLDRAFTGLGDQMVAELQQSVIDTNSPPLKPETIARKGFAKPLVADQHQLLNAASKRIK